MLRRISCTSSQRLLVEYDAGWIGSESTVNVPSGRTVKAPQIRRVDRASAAKIAHLLRIRHRDEVEAPITDWLREAYDWSASAARQRVKRRPARPAANARRTPRVRRT